MRTLYSVLLLGFLAAGCSTVQVPQYVQDRHPYKRQYDATYTQTLKAVKQTIKDYDWTITGTSDPGVFEYSAVSGSPQSRQILIFTKVKESTKLLFSRYQNLNVYVRSLDKGSEVEIRYAIATPLPFKTFKGHRNDLFISQLFSHIDRLLESR